MNLNNNAFLRIDNLSKQFDGTMAVDNISFSVNQGELVSILGPSGCGKTTLLKMIGGFIEPDKGKIFLDKDEISKMSPDKRNTCMVFQNYALFPHMSVAQNVGFGLKIKKIPKPEIDQRVAELLGMVQMEKLSHRKPGELSGGQQQRVALARALSMNPKMLLLDEPFSSLDANLRQRMQKEIRAIHDKLGIPIIFVTHDQEEAMSISDKIVVLKKGRICQTGSPTEIYHKPLTHFVANFVGKANLFSGNVESIDTDSELMDIKTPWGSITVNREHKNFTPGDAVTLLARPESIHLMPSPPRSKSIKNCFSARVISALFSGSHVRYQLACEYGVIVADQISSKDNNIYCENDNINIALPQGMHLLHGNTTVKGMH
jgi:spermidine/putrescine ABC transporter ATP-binding subunit